MLRRRRCANFAYAPAMHDFRIEGPTGLTRLFAAAPTFELTRPAKAHLPVIVAQGADGELQLRAIECHVLRRLEFECQIPFRSRELQLSRDHFHFRSGLCVHLLVRAVQRNNALPARRSLRR